MFVSVGRINICIDFSSTGRELIVCKWYGNVFYGDFGKNTLFYDNNRWRIRQSQMEVRLFQDKGIERLLSQT